MSIKDEVYVEARMKLIPAATKLGMRNAKEYHRVNKMKGKLPRHLVDRFFQRAMTTLAVEEGLIDEGNLILMNADDLPSGVGRLNPLQRKVWD